MLLIDLDENTALLVLKHLDPKDLICMQTSCQWGKTLASHDSLWKAICTDRFKTWNTHLLSASPGSHEAGFTGPFFLLASSSPFV